MQLSLLIVLALVGCTRTDTDTDTGAPAEPNEAPGATIIELTPALPTTEQDVSVVHISEAVDPNGDAVTYRYTWFRDGELQDDLTEATLPADRTARDESWRVVVVPTDGELDGPAEDGQVVVQNTPPTLSASLTPTEPYTLDDLQVEVTTNDVDGDEVSVAWQWTIDDVPTLEYSGLVPASETTRDQVWHFTATPSDGTSTGAAAEGSVTILNSAPTVALEVLVDGAPAADVYTTTLLETSIEVDDADGDEVSVSYAWTVAGSDAGSESSLDGAVAFDRDEEVVVTVLPNDGTTDGEAVLASFTVLDTPPTPASFALSPGAPEPGDALVCVVVEEAFDLDGDPITYTFDWDVDGSAFTATEDTTYTGDTVPDGTTERGDLWTCSVTTEAGGVTLDAQSHSVETRGCHPFDPVTVTGWTRSYDSVYENEAGTEEQTGLGDGDYRSVLATTAGSWDVVQRQSCLDDGSVVQEGWEGDVALSTFAGVDLSFFGTIPASSTNDGPRPYLLPLGELESGATWSYTYDTTMVATLDFGVGPTDYTQGTVTAGTYEVIGEEAVTVPAGTFTALHLRNTYTQQPLGGDTAQPFPVDSNNVSDVYYVDGLGLIKEVTTRADDPAYVVMSKELTAFTNLTPLQ